MKVFDLVKCKRQLNKYKLKYQSTLEEKLKDKEKIIELQNNLLGVSKLYEDLKKENKQLKRELENVSRKK